jgi:cell fate regulator YaaT (PSP1 superfamily)
VERPKPGRRNSGVRYGAMHWIGEFRQPAGLDLSPGANVVIQTDRGLEVGQSLALACQACAQSVSREQMEVYVERSGAEFYRWNCGSILRAATPQDLDEHRRLNADITADVQRCAAAAARLNLDMKVVTAEHLLGGERIVFYFRAEGRVDFRQLVRELAQYYQTRIEMRQVGARDEARLVADYEICGRECCCRDFLKKLQPVNMKMAKLQKSTLDPSKVSGRCGRLRCCLRFEHEGYEELARKLPRVNSRVDTTEGIGSVLDRQVLAQLVLVRLEADRRELVIPLEQVIAFNLPKPKPVKALTDEGVPGDAAIPTDAGRQKSRFAPDAPAAAGADDPKTRPAPQPPEVPDAEPARPRPQAESPADEQTRKEQAKPPAGRSSAARRRRRRRRPGRRRPEKPPDAEET